jgi:chloramphenicol O-acetyltransferase type A
MARRIVDLDTWARADQFRFFRTYGKPHYAVTSRLDVSRLMARKARGVSPYRACPYAIGAGIHAMPELRMRFRGETVTEYERIDLSMTVPLPNGNYNYAYVPWEPDFPAFDRLAREIIASVTGGRNANAGERDDLAYLSCLPWLDFTSINNALPGPEDCIPRVSRGKFAEEPGGFRMAMAIEVHHALGDGRQVGEFFAAVQRALDAV